MNRQPAHITGASSGLGQALALGVVGPGAEVIRGRRIDALESARKFFALFTAGPKKKY
jgi:NADP-dependent 3-hydroxy acid dehydrogenase YdfG